MRIYWQPSIEVMKARAEKAGHRLRKFDLVERRRSGVRVRRTTCSRCGEPFYLEETAEGFINVPLEFEQCRPSLRQPAA